MKIYNHAYSKIESIDFSKSDPSVSCSVFRSPAADFINSTQFVPHYSESNRGPFPRIDPSSELQKKLKSSIPYYNSKKQLQVVGQIYHLRWWRYSTKMPLIWHFVTTKEFQGGREPVFDDINVYTFFCHKE